MKNPYTLGPVYGEKFYGRRELIGLINNIPSGENRRMLIVGACRMGNTSLLKQMESELNPNSDVGISLSLEGVNTREDFKNSFEMACGSSKSLQNNNVKFDRTKDIQSILSDLQKTDKRRLFLFIDNAENLAKLGERFLRTLRVSFEETQVNLTLAASQEIYKLREVSPDWLKPPFLDESWIYQLGPLDNQESEKLITQNQQIKVPYEIVREIQEQTGNHPHFIQLLCTTLFEKSGIHRNRVFPKNSVSDPQNILWKGIYNKANQLGIIEQLYHLLSPLQQEIIVRIFEKESMNIDEFREEIDKSIDEGTFQSSLNALKELGYISKNYRISNYFLREWLTNQDKDYLLSIRLLDKISTDLGHTKEKERRYAYRKTKSEIKSDNPKVKKAAIETMGAIFYYLPDELKEDALKNAFWSILSDESEEPLEFKEIVAIVLIFSSPHLSKEQKRQTMEILDKPNLRKVKVVDDFLKQYKEISEYTEYFRNWDTVIPPKID